MHALNITAASSVKPASSPARGTGRNDSLLVPMRCAVGTKGLRRRLDNSMSCSKKRCVGIRARTAFRTAGAGQSGKQRYRNDKPAGPTMSGLVPCQKSYAATRLLVRGGQHPADADKGGAGDAVEPAREPAAPEPGREPRRRAGKPQFENKFDADERRC